MLPNNENNLISIDDFISRAKKLGVDFGPGNPKERLRYLTKIGLLPHVKRKSFNGQSPNGAYPEYVIELLVEIDKKIKAGKNIQALKKEKERKILIESSSTYIYPQYLPTLEGHQLKIETPQTEKEPEIKKTFLFFPRMASIFRIVFLILILGGIVFFFADYKIREDIHSYFLASLRWVGRIAQAPPPDPVIYPAREVREIFPLFRPEPHLTINAETDINARLNVREEITTPALVLRQGEFEATLASAALTAERTHIFPDLSGVVCLTAGNCIGLGGEVFSPGGLPNRLARFFTAQEIGVSSIEDFYPGVALTIDLDGRVGIGIREPVHALHVMGRIQATGDICTDLGGGKCLSELVPPAPPAPPIFLGGGIGGFGTAGRLPVWASRTTLEDSIISQSGSVINVDGTVRMLGFQLSTDAVQGHILISDAEGIGTWQPAPVGALPPGLTGQTLRHDGTDWIADSFLHNTGTAIGIGTTLTPATLTLSGNALFATTTVPQLVLQYNDGNHLTFAIDGEQSLIEASRRMVLNSLTGEIKLGANVNIFDAFGAIVRADTFISAPDDSTVRKSGELVLQASIPIFRFPIAAQTTSTNYVVVSRVFSPTDSLDLITPPQLPGTDRVYAFLINFADNIAATASSTWRVRRPIAATTTFAFEFSGQNLPSFEVGNSHLTATTALPDNDWQLEVKIPSADNAIRIFNIFLLTFDKIR